MPMLTPAQARTTALSTSFYLPDELSSRQSIPGPTAGAVN